MRIGIDAKWYFSGPPSGVNVVRNIVNTIIDTNKTDHIILYLNKKDKDYEYKIISKIKKCTNITYKYIPSPTNTITNLLFYPVHFQKDKLDCIIFQNYIPVWRLSNVKYIAYVHDFLFIDYPQYFTLLENVIYRIMKYSVDKSDMTITISKSERSRIYKNTLKSKSKIQYVHHGLDKNFYVRSKKEIAKIRARYTLPKQYILYVGRLNVRKNISRLVFSMKYIPKNIHLLIIGKSDNNIDIETLILNEGLKNRSTIMGHVTDKKLSEVVSAAEVFVFPSFAEGFGLPPLEAMKSGIPSVVTKLTSLPEVCQDGASYFDVKDTQDLASKIVNLINNKDLRMSKISKGLEVASKYDWVDSVTKIRKIIALMDSSEWVKCDIGSVRQKKY